MFGNNVNLSNNSGIVTLGDAGVAGNVYVQNNTGPATTVHSVTAHGIIYCSPATGTDNTAKKIYGTCLA